MFHFNASFAHELWLHFHIQILGYLSGASPHVKSGAISALSVLVYEDADIYLSIPDLVPSLLSLLQGKAIEVIKVCILALGSIFISILISAITSCSYPLNRQC